jgi:hypothetical protein
VPAQQQVAGTNTSRSGAAERWLSTAGGQIRQYRLACDCSLAFAHEHLRSFWKVDIDARAESDHANALTYCDGLGFAAKADDAPSDKS